MASSGSLLDPFCCTSYLAMWAVSLRIDHRIFVFYAPVLLFAYLIVRPFKNNVINILRGPKPTSFFLGNLGQYLRDEVGAHEFKWNAKYGNAFRLRGLFCDDRLWISDPLGLQHIFQRTGTTFVRPSGRREIGRIMMGEGIIYAQGNHHRRHRKILTPAFNAAEMRTLIPIFTRTARKVCCLWKREMEESQDKRVEVVGGLTVATLDAIGEAAFCHQFDGLGGQNDSLAEAYSSFLTKSFALPTSASIFVINLLDYLPVSFTKMLEKLPSRSLEAVKAVQKEGVKTAKDLIRRKLSNENMTIGNEKDILTLLVRANLGENGKGNLSEEELVAQVRTILIAGHETTSSTIGFMLWELSQHLEVQTRAREEIMASLENRDIDDLSAPDFERMVYLIAIVKETLRLHPILYGPYLVATEDNTIPLSQPVTDEDGTRREEILVQKGDIIYTSIAAYNRLPEVWGPDSHEFKPERWLDGAEWKIYSPFGIYSRLGTFASGNTACLGWRFAVYEVQSYLIEILRHFSLRYPDNVPPLIRPSCGLMVPVLKGEEAKGKQLILELNALDVVH